LGPRGGRGKDILDLFVFLTGKALHVPVDALGLREAPAHDLETITGEGREQRAWYREESVTLSLFRQPPQTKPSFLSLTKGLAIYRRIKVLA
jgi:hypothetical protein